MLQATGLAAFRGERLVFRDLDFARLPPAGAAADRSERVRQSTLLRLLAGSVAARGGT